MTEKQKQIITRMRAQGAGYTTVAAATGLTKDCVRAWCRRHGMGGFAKKSAATETAPGVCRNCGEKFDIVPGRKPRKFCCDECRVEWWNSHPEMVRRKAVYTFVCPVCGREFTAYGNAGRKYCSRACYIKDRFEEERA